MPLPPAPPSGTDAGRPLPETQPTDTVFALSEQVFDLDTLGGTLKDPILVDASTASIRFVDRASVGNVVEITGFGADDEIFLDSQPTGVSSDGTAVQVTINDAGVLSHLILTGVANADDLVFNVETFNADPAVGNIIVGGDDGIDNGVYRFFNSDTGVHFYTGSGPERDLVLETLPQFNFEGASFRAADDGDGADPVFRFFNQQTGVHFYTISEAERDLVQDTLPQFVFEGEAYSAHAEPVEGSIPLFRFFNAETGAHFYTPSEPERDLVIETLPTFTPEGVAYYVEPLIG